eukprot:2291938-Amphidinium_carterae.1
MISDRTHVHLNCIPVQSSTVLEVIEQLACCHRSVFGLRIQLESMTAAWIVVRVKVEAKKGNGFTTD